MTNVNELKDALKETLEEKGELNKIRAMMRAAIFEAIETDDKPKPKLTDENLIINELIREYMRYNNYLHSHSVFTSESGQPVDPPFDRTFIAKELNIIEDSTSKKVPLLYSILFGLKKEVYAPNEVVGNSSITNKYKEQSVNLQSTDLNNKHQPQPWIID